MAKFVVNGKEYDSLEAMPPEARAAYQQIQGMFADTNKNGVPDLFEGAAVNVQTVSMDRSTISGQQLSPEEAQRVMGQVMGAFGADQAGPAGFRSEPPPSDDWFRSSQPMPSVPQWDAPRTRPRMGVKQVVILLVVLDLLVLGGFLAWQFWLK